MTVIYTIFVPPAKGGGMENVMEHLKRYTVIGIFFVLVTGSIAHFLYEWSGYNRIVGLFTPVNESVWEHMKLLFFPMLVYSVILILRFRRKYSCLTSALYFGIFIGTFLIPILYYTYTYFLGKNVFILDIGTFILSSVFAFWISYGLTRSGRLESYTSILGLMVCVLSVCFVVFTFDPLDFVIFQDPSH